MPTFQDHFSQQAAEYASYRPRYPARLGHELAALCPVRELALDCGCGSGQLSVVLARMFDHVVATDASAEQIASAEPCRNVTYRVAPAEESHLPSHSVDLVTVAQAVHWFDLEPFYVEVQRLLKPAGVLALVTYGRLVVDDETCNSIIENFYGNALAPFWPPERELVETGYRTLPFPFDELAVPVMRMEANWNFDALVGYISTWSACKALQKSEGPSKFEDFADRMSRAWGDRAGTKLIMWPLSVRAGRRRSVDR